MIIFGWIAATFLKIELFAKTLKRGRRRSRAVYIIICRAASASYEGVLRLKNSLLNKPRLFILLHLLLHCFYVWEHFQDVFFLLLNARCSSINFKIILRDINTRDSLSAVLLNIIKGSTIRW